MAASPATVHRALCLALLLGCATRPPPPPPPPPRPAPIEPLRAEALPEGVIRTMPLHGGRTLSLRADGALTRTTAGVEDARVTVADPARCALHAWGERGFAACEGEGESVMFAPTAPALGVLRGDMARVIAGRDGRTLARAGACDANRGIEARTESAACRWVEGVGWRTWTVDRPQAQLLDIYGQRALLRWTERTELPERPAVAHEVVGLYDIDGGHWVPLTASEPTARWICAGFDDEGWVRGIVHTGTTTAPRAWRVLGDETGGAGPRLQARPLPFAAEDFAEIDETRAVFVRGDEAVLMRDATHVAPVRGEGALTARPWRHATRCGERVACDGLRCVIDGIWQISVPAPRDPLAP